MLRVLRVVAVQHQHEAQFRSGGDVGQALGEAGEGSAWQKWGRE